MNDHRTRIARRCGLVLAAALSLSATAVPAATLYVTNEMDGTLSVIDTVAQKRTATLALGKRPRGVQLGPDGRRLYVALSGSPPAGPGVDESTLPPPDKSADGIGIVALPSLKLLRVLRGVSDPEQLAVSHDGRELYVASEDTGQLLVLDAGSGATRAAIDVGGEPEGVAVDPQDGTVYVASERDAQVAVVDPHARRRVATIAVGKRPRAIVFNADGTRAYVSNEAGASISVIDAKRRREMRRIALGDASLRPMGLALDASGRKLYVATGRAARVLALDTQSGEVLASVDVGPRAWGLALCADEQRLYSANGPSNDVSVIDVASFRTLGRIASGAKPWGAVCAPAQADAPR